MSNKQPTKVFLRGSKQNIYLAPRDSPRARPMSPQPVDDIPDPPPQAQRLFDEYMNNMKAQLNSLIQEIRILHDRTNDAGGDFSIDSSIRRLRLATVKREEETNKKILELKDEIAQIDKQIAEIDLIADVGKLQAATEEEKEKSSDLRNIYVNFASDFYFKNLENAKRDQENFVIQEQILELNEVLDEQYKKRDSLKAEDQQLTEEVKSLKASISDLLKKLSDLIKEGRLFEEQTEVEALVTNEPEREPANVPIQTIQAKNAKLELELKSILQERNNVESKLDVLLEQNIIAKANVNQLQADLSRAQDIKILMDKKYETLYKEISEKVERQNQELFSLRAFCKEAKNDIYIIQDDYLRLISTINETHGQVEFHKRGINFKKDTMERLQSKNSELQEQIEESERILDELRKDLNDLSEKIAAASEKNQRTKAYLEILSENPKCQLASTPDLNALLHYIREAKSALKE